MATGPALTRLRPLRPLLERIVEAGAGESGARALPGRPAAVTILTSARLPAPREKPLTPNRLLPWLAALAGAGAILSFVGGLPPAWGVALKPLATLLILAFAWPRGADAPRQRRFIRIGLLLSLIGDVFLLWPDEGFLPGLIAFLLAHLAYIAAFCVPVRLAARPAVFVGYGAVAAAILLPLWPGVPAALRAPVLAYVLCLATMAAQAGVWWRAGRADAPLARRAALGGLLFMASDSLLAINRFGVPLPLSALWILSTYWLAQGCIASALRPR
jgi:uncharacterized membrane protein YhhN